MCTYVWLIIIVCIEIRKFYFKEEKKRNRKKKKKKELNCAHGMLFKI